MRVVIADDSKIMRDRLRQWLRVADCRIVGQAENAKAALALCYQEKPDLAILDVLMPPGSGKDAALELAREKAVPCILVVSSNSQDVVFKQLRDQGIYLLTKPVSDGQFAAKIEEIKRGFSR